MFIYALCEPDLWQAVRYVGASRNPAIRLRQHVVPSRLAKQDNPALATWLLSLRKRGARPVMRILEETLAQNWREVEDKWIVFYRDQGAPITNMLLGVGTITEEAHRNRQARWTPEQRQKKAEELRRMWATPELRAKRAKRQGQVKTPKMLEPPPIKPLKRSLSSMVSGLPEHDSLEAAERIAQHFGLGKLSPLD